MSSPLQQRLDDELLTIAVALDSIFSPAIEAFSSAAAACGSGPSSWAGLDADARARLSATGRRQVHALRDAFARAQGVLDALPRGSSRASSPAVVHARHAAARLELQRLVCV